MLKRGGSIKEEAFYERPKTHQHPLWPSNAESNGQAINTLYRKYDYVMNKSSFGPISRILCNRQTTLQVKFTNAT